jgi:hypothetical protein
MADDESPDERLDRELGELLQELRVALPWGASAGTKATKNGCCAAAPS